MVVYTGCIYRLYIHITVDNFNYNYNVTGFYTVLFLSELVIDGDVQRIYNLKVMLELIGLNEMSFQQC